jgi:hypothetical protein
MPGEEAQRLAGAATGPAGRKAEKQWAEKIRDYLLYEFYKSQLLMPTVWFQILAPGNFSASLLPASQRAF